MELFLQGFPYFFAYFLSNNIIFRRGTCLFNSNGADKFKIGFCFMVSLIGFLTYGIKQTIVPDAGYILAVFREILVGVLLGFRCLSVFYCRSNGWRIH